MVEARVRREKERLEKLASREKLLAINDSAKFEVSRTKLGREEKRGNLTDASTTAMEENRNNSRVHK